jgi:cyclopropane-fatty-acyl-phospholipid synthase
MSSAQKLVAELRRRYAAVEHRVPLALRLPSGETEVLGDEEPSATLVIADERGVEALGTFDLATVADAYLNGHIDAEGELSDILTLRGVLTDRHPLQFAFRFISPLFRGQVKSDQDWITHHYEEDPDFFLAFLDRRHRAYSQGVFLDDGESLEDAITHKLDFAIEAVGAQPGDRVLDIGAGWGAFTEYGGQKGLHVTSLTISEESRSFVSDLIEKQELPCEVRREHFFAHEPRERYDAIVNLGVTEHLPDYPRTLKKYRSLLKPGGRVYLDASASRRRHRVSTFVEKQLFPGNGHPLVLRSYIRALSGTPMELEVVHNDRKNYELTTRHWAQNLDANREVIEDRWGPRQYRLFRLWLWGCVDGFRRDVIQAYRLVLRAP